MIFAVVVVALWHTSCGAGPYSPTWESLDTRANPAWYQNSRLGIKIHWGERLVDESRVVLVHICCLHAVVHAHLDQP